MFIKKMNSHIVLDFLFFKAKFRTKHPSNIHLEGENNEIIVYDKDGNRINYIDSKSISQFKINIVGNNNKISFWENENFSNMNIRIKGNSNSVKIDKTDGPVSMSINMYGGGVPVDGRVVEVGKNFACGGCTMFVLNSGNKVIIGDDCLFSDTIQIRTTDGHKVIDNTTNEILNKEKGTVEIQDHVWICRDVLILKDALISKDSVVGAKSLVNKKFNESNIIIAGRSSIVKRNIRWEN